MRVAIIGARGCSDLNHAPLVNQIIDDCKQRHSNLLVVVASCDKGIGKIVKSRNLDPHRVNKYEFDMIELQLRHYLQADLPRPEFTSHWNALNAAIVELGDEFHIITAETPKGVTQDLIKRVKEAKRRIAIYKLSDIKNGPKVPEILE